MSFKDEIRR